METGTNPQLLATTRESLTPGEEGASGRRPRRVAARIPLQLRRPLLDAFHDFAVEAGDDKGAITVLETAPVIRRQKRGWDHLIIDDGPALYAIHTMLVRLATIDDVIESATAREVLATARLARRVADRVRHQLQGTAPGAR